jgi:hypothetical protein
MGEFDRLVIEAAIMCRVGKPDVIDYLGPNINPPMTTFLDVARHASGREIDLFWVEGGIPGHFALSDEKSLPVIFHARQVELCAHLRSITFSHVLDGIPGLFEGVTLRIIAEFLLQRGHIDQALQTLAKSYHFLNGITFLEPQITQLQQLPLDERYLVEWFFGLGHEIGHAAEPYMRKQISFIDALDPSWIAHVVNELIDIRSSNDARVLLKGIIQRGENGDFPKSHASPSVIREEIFADLFSILCISQAWANICAESTGRALQPETLLVEAIVSMSNLMVIEQCRILAGWFSNINDELEQQPLKLSGIALKARINLLIHIFQNENTLSLLNETFPGVSAFQTSWRDSFNNLMLAMEKRSKELTEDFGRARKFLSSSEMRDPNLFYNYLEQVAEDYTTGYDALRFLAVADSQKASSPELNLLRDTAEKCISQEE